MQIELNRATFRRLVQLYLVTLVLSLTLVGLEFFIPRWLEFSDRFDALVTEMFGASESSDTVTATNLAMLSAILTWMLASSIGLLWYRRWARFGVWASTVAMYGEMLIVDGYRPSYASPALDIFATLDGMLLGAIVVLAYAKNYGAGWFMANTTKIQE